MDLRVNIPEGASGRFSVRRFSVSQEEASRFNLRSMFSFGGGRRNIKPGTYTGLYAQGQHDPWMSDTPAEAHDHRAIIGKIKQSGGNVLINGLGLGLVVKATLAFSNVTRVDVVEIEPDVLKLVGPTYAADPRVHLHEADALTFRPERGVVWDVVWHDIWPTICGDNVEQMSVLHRRYGHWARYQDSWCRWEVKRLHRAG